MDRLGRGWSSRGDAVGLAAAVVGAVGIEVGAGVRAELAAGVVVVGAGGAGGWPSVAGGVGSVGSDAVRVSRVPVACAVRPRSMASAGSTMVQPGSMWLGKRESRCSRSGLRAWMRG